MYLKYSDMSEFFFSFWKPGTITF